MNILGVDPALATCGWSVVTPRTGKVIACGVITTEHDGAIDKSVDGPRRIAAVGAELARIRAQHHCTRIVAEEMLLHGTTHAVVPQVLCWGMLVMLAVTSGVSLELVVSKTWQHAITGQAKGKVDYAVVKAGLSKFIGYPLQLIPKELRTHAIDASGVGMMGALRPQQTTRIVAAATARQNTATTEAA